MALLRRWLFWLFAAFVALQLFFVGRIALPIYWRPLGFSLFFPVRAIPQPCLPAF